jgi:hypothetical protein
MTETVKAVVSQRHLKVLFQVLQQNQHLFVGSEASGGCQYSYRWLLIFPLQTFPLVGVCAEISVAGWWKCLGEHLRIKAA